MTSPARDRILDALESMLLVTGPSGISLEDVAVRAGVSKGGLLYHFSSKQALLLGFVARTADTARAELREVAEQGLDPVVVSLDKAGPGWREDDAGFRSAVACVRCADGNDPELTTAVVAALRVWDDGLLAGVTDRTRREILRLVSHGLLLDAVLDSPIPDEVHADVVARLSSPDSPDPTAP